MDCRVNGTVLNLGDTVRLFHGAFSDALVTNKTEKELTFYRPYAVHADFSYTGGVICYTGIETFSAPIENQYILIQRANTIK